MKVLVTIGITVTVVVFTGATIYGWRQVSLSDLIDSTLIAGAVAGVFFLAFHVGQLVGFLIKSIMR